jgi:hypothetical protein
MQNGHRSNPDILPRTMVPVRSLMITLAGRSDSTVRFSKAAMNSVGREVYSVGMVHSSPGRHSRSSRPEKRPQISC